MDFKNEKMGRDKMDISNQESEICKFYNQKTILITGAAGFLGQVILEILLRCCPGILRIYILLRPKGGLTAEDRKEQVFKKILFQNLIEKTPDVLNKVIAVSGDVSEEKLGMCDKDYNRITKEVAIVFHCAACVSFFKPISFLIHQNVIGTSNVIDLCKKSDKFEALVYTSTLFSNANLKGDIKEIVYEMPFKVEEAIRLFRNNDIETLNKLYSKWNPHFVNYYLFSKVISENLLLQEANNLPVSIIRPSLIINCMKGSLPGYIEKGSALVNLGEGVGKGFIRVLYLPMHGKLTCEFIPADIAANTHIVAAFLQATKRMPSPSVYNCNYSAFNWDTIIRSVIDLVSKYPLPDTYIKPSTMICSNLFLYKFLIIIYHFIPAAAVDMFLCIAGKKPWMLKTYRFVERVHNFTNFVHRQWCFECENFETLSEKLNKKDSEIFYVDMRDIDLEKYKLSGITGSPQYRVNNKIYKENLKDSLLRYFLTILFNIFHLAVIFALLYSVFAILSFVLS